ncbi:hypothetical protein A3B21_04170 [Candidatus Uhrbacteria bacterium RIFCSPLOWO2_01_FULL_47_24]|uniref:Metallo-beta-lactamase domain-containing protein n=1 Tax=Candidatus Uhrbacteria bacterium RIFCSPLOWO2_01_FULL_47_24 TaxID=1802401 RepID=A0A1F7UTK2_9BACT|nr:MAG: hypothetical protein A2753_02485 [Candidatus Uhrbacteria bacterium RIFCSPHIGHO2_01_FULL_47_11]OGL68781.1 MAG: hypothetical protein A3D58_01375 [Candidatus Uhrbacteria bacterium RIFCSPHIGHO2_02_FULL_46_47]OGL75243.1 MAG: hypothetical protein A3F52_05055 [Candidatus Uhrbacteria bacterium RIFCSPHIGHO2_12_FULL_47_11]OGL81586.1 MAG: hypothetical protein A3B21_04170 [Candidatus Uhrbacteria bacterium RIFCSPLOWO2_01_FULL_47_24]OGL83968.1 MAG: hypothetical protein A3J03_00935 [Candidatus Uhrbact
MFGNKLEKLHELYKSFVPTHWRTRARWVWGIALVSAILWTQFLHTGDAPLTVYFFDVGQGDGYLIRTAQGFDVLVDGGPTDKIVEKLGRVMPFWDKDIELMILTHPHADHVTGLIEVLKRFQVKHVLATGVLHTTDEYLLWLKEIKEKNIPMTIAKARQVWTLSHSAALSPTKSALGFPCEETGACAQPSSSAVADAMPAGLPQHFCCEPSPRSGFAESKLEILYPEEIFEGERVVEGKTGEGGGLNDTSIVAKLTYGNTSFLLMGDATSAVEEQLLQEYNANQRISCQSTNTNSQFVDLNKICKFALQSDVLKVGHHGSKYSTSREFLKTVQPKYAVIQVGKNRYGHPAFATLYRLKQAGVEIFRNDTDGDVVLESDGRLVRSR